MLLLLLFFFPKRKSLEKIFLLNYVKDNNFKREDNVIGKNYLKFEEGKNLQSFS